jgi:DNA-binding winged helix-turn-helix (wHTH) protein/TolB-like protein/tetratricopeptide (TPR) repeat protein
MQAPLSYEFDDFRLDPVGRRLWRSGHPVTLTDRQFEALLLFVTRAGQLLDKDTLLAELWPGLVVEENNLNQVISTLRRALGELSHENRYIQTVPRRGYRFVARVKEGGSSSVEAAAPVESDPAGETTPAAPPSVPATRRRAFFGMGVSAWVATGLMGTGAVGWWATRNLGTGVAISSPQTIAVLPFKPLVNEGRDQLLEVGMADSLIARLSTVPGLVVRSVGSVRRYGGPDQDPLSAARELNVIWIVDGSLQRWGDQVRVTARLLRTTDGVAAWSGSFDERFTNMFDVQDAISERVARVLAPQLAVQDRQRLMGAGGTRNPDAYQLYLAARMHAQTLRAEGLRKSVTLYEKAIALDPSYALAYAGVAETYRRMIFGADAAPMDALEPARVAARQATKIDPLLAEGHASLGWVSFWYDWDWPGAEAHFRRAIQLNPNVVEAHFGLGLLLLTLDRGDEGLRHLQTARELDPASLILNTLEAAFLFARGQRDAANARLARVLDIQPEFWIAHLTRARFDFVENKPEQAIEVLRRADQLSDGSTQAAGLLGFILARQGRRDEAQAVLGRLLTAKSSRYVPPTSVAMIYSGLGAVDPALDELERAYKMRDTRLVYLKDDPRWDGLRKEPRFIALLQRMKLDSYGPGTPAN